MIMVSISLLLLVIGVIAVVGVLIYVIARQIDSNVNEDFEERDN